MLPFSLEKALKNRNELTTAYLKWERRKHWRDNKNEREATKAYCLAHNFLQSFSSLQVSSLILFSDWHNLQYIILYLELHSFKKIFFAIFHPQTAGKKTKAKNRITILLSLLEQFKFHYQDVKCICYITVTFTNRMLSEIKLSSPAA